MGAENRSTPEGVAPVNEGNSLPEKEALQAVQVALNIRPLISLERAQGCKDCITVVPGEPQVTFLLSSESTMVLFMNMPLSALTFYAFLETEPAMCTVLHCVLFTTRSRDSVVENPECLFLICL